MEDFETFETYEELIKSGNIAEFTLLMKKDGPFMVKELVNEDEQNLLHIAVIENSEEFVVLLLKHNFSMFRDKRGNAPWAYINIEDDCVNYKELFFHADFDFDLSSTGDIDFFNKLCSKGSNSISREILHCIIDHVVENECSKIFSPDFSAFQDAFINSVYRGDTTLILRFLGFMNPGEFCSVRDTDAYTIAIERDDIQTLKCLFLYPGYENWQDQEEGNTILILALKHEAYKVYEYLIGEKKASYDDERQDNDGSSALEHFENIIKDFINIDDPHEAADKQYDFTRFILLMKDRYE